VEVWSRGKEMVPGARPLHQGIRRSAANVSAAAKDPAIKGAIHHATGKVRVNKHAVVPESRIEDLFDYASRAAKAHAARRHQNLWRCGHR
jgi:hypothetical protein